QLQSESLLEPSQASGCRLLRHAALARRRRDGPVPHRRREQPQRTDVGILVHHTLTALACTPIEDSLLPPPAAHSAGLNHAVLPRPYPPRPPRPSRRR